MKKGTKQRRTLARETVMKFAGITPLEYMLHVLQSPPRKYGTRERMWAAKEAAPYVHRKMPQAVEVRDITEEEREKMTETVLKLEKLLAAKARKK